jgi:mannosylglycerate hydrolase
MGTLSVRAPDKQLYARATRTIERLAEPAAALSGLEMTEPLQQSWTLILQNAAHDTACGSGIDAVAEAARNRSASALQLAGDVVDRCLPALAAEGEVWNPSAFPRQGVIEVNGRAMLTPMIAGCSSGRLEDVSPMDAVSASPKQLENASLRVDLHPDASISVLDKGTGVRYHNLHQLVDEADAGDEYNFSPPPEPDNPIQTALRGGVWKVIEAGPLRGRVEVRTDRSIHRGLRADRRRRSADPVGMPVRVVISLDANSPQLDLELEIENRATDHRLRAHFSLPFVTRESAADTPFHVTRRAVVEPHRDPAAPELELPTYPMRSFVDVSDGRAGLALITDGLHEYEVLTGDPQVLALTLIRAVGWLSRGDLLTRSGHAGPAMETPGAQVLGHHRFRYSLYFHAGSWEQANVWRIAESTLLPLQLGRGSARPSVTPLMELAPDCIQMTACIPEANGFALRLLNASDQPHDANVRLRPRPTKIEAISLAGALQDRVAIAEGVKLSMRPWEMATLRVSR